MPTVSNKTELTEDEVREAILNYVGIEHDRHVNVAWEIKDGKPTGATITQITKKPAEKKRVEKKGCRKKRR
tara:strand:+ start:36468 stop:36680 length:213 start_codon:yes stop_codon:yes gene_type:complete